MTVKLKRTPGIYIVGFMASGKTTIGRDLAQELGWSFFDIDQEIEACEHMTIADIFDTRGEPEFRRIEREIVRTHVRIVERGRPAVIALGGGAFANQETFELLQNNGVTVWLDCPFSMVERRVLGASHRPLARDPQRMRHLYESRREFYARADYRVEISSDDPADVVANILALPIF